MLFSTNKEKGNSGLVAAIGYYGMLGYTISIPLNDTLDYDLVVDNGERLLKILVKATGQRSPLGYSIVTVSSSGGTKGEVYKTIKDTNVDILFVLTELLEMYEIPIQEITTTRTINLGPDKQCFRVDKVDTFYFLKSNIKEKKYCQECGVEVSDTNVRGLCHACALKKRQIVERPSKEQLLEELKNSNFTAVGKKYGVSDNTIRKWCIGYNLPTHTKEIKNFQL